MDAKRAVAAAAAVDDAGWRQTAVAVQAVAYLQPAIQSFDHASSTEH